MGSNINMIFSYIGIGLCAVFLVILMYSFIYCIGTGSNIVSPEPKFDI